MIDKVSQIKLVHQQINTIDFGVNLDQIHMGPPLFLGHIEPRLFVYLIFWVYTKTYLYRTLQK